MGKQSSGVNQAMMEQLRRNRRKEIEMMRGSRVFLLIALVIPVLMGVTLAYGEDPKPTGKVALESKSIAVGIGVSWGEGALEFKGNKYPFSVEGLSLVDVGIAKASVVGDVYHLTDASKFPGTYVAAEAGFTLAGGMGGMVVRNQNGVVIHLRSVSEGARLQLGTGGFTVKMKE